MIELTIAIPTYNRANYLVELLESLYQDLSIVNRNELRVELLISDNASSDGTPGKIQPYRVMPWFRYECNSANLGGDYNFTLCVERAKGRYVWIFGDDDLYRQGALPRLLGVLEKAEPSFVIAGNEVVETGLYDSYRSLLKEAIWRDPLFALNHTLITSNIFMKDRFDVSYARFKLKSSYCHMYALIDGLASNESVYVFSKDKSLFGIRKIRADFAVFPEDLHRKQKVYLIRLSMALGSLRLRLLSFWGYNVLFESRMFLEGLYRKYFRNFYKRHLKKRIGLAK